MKEFLNSIEGAEYKDNNLLGYDGDTLKLAQIFAVTDGIPYSPRKELNPIYESFEDLVDKFNRNSPEGMNHAIQTARSYWAWMDSELAFVSNAIQGMIIAIAFSFGILVLSTLNIFIALYSTLSIGGIIACVLAIMKFHDWEFAVAESVSCVIIIGFSVDYVVHLGNHYVEATYTDRYNRIREALKQMGISILGGAITTFGAGVPLFFCIILFFNKYAILITTTITYSLLFSLGFFTAICHIIGPNGTTGDLRPLLKKALEKFKKCCQRKTVAKS